MSQKLTTYSGNVPSAQPPYGPIRQISDIKPVKGADIPSTNHCQLIKMAVSTTDSEIFSALLLFTKFPLHFFLSWCRITLVR